MLRPIKLLMQLYRIDEYDIVTRVMDDKTYVAVYLHLEEAKS